MILALFLSLIAGFADVLGGFLSVAKKVDQKTLRYFISTSAGFILAVTILDLYPEVVSGIESGPLLILVGFVAIFMMENLFANTAHEGAHEHEHTLLGRHFEDDVLKEHSVWAAFLGLLIHTFFDGAAISARILASPAAGILVFIAVLSHKVPEGFSMASIFLAGGSARSRSFLAAVTLGFSTIFGALVVYLTQQTQFSLVFLGLAAGSFTYIASSELVPFISGTKDKKGIWFFLLGVVLFYLTSRLLATFGLK
ncbi:MAG: ZIP family metal transporter [bacterium]|nr:ZIP family metal transporter [bacterium]